VRADDHLGVVVERMLASGLREIPVLDDAGRLLGCIDDQTLAKAYQGRAPPIA
jgi:predicted transcriptional regulator